ENERFIFYRGLGSFDTPLHVTDAATLHNDSDQDVAFIVRLRVDDTGGWIEQQKGVPAHGAIGGAPLFPATAAQDEPMDAFIAHAKTLVKSGLVSSGLTDAES